LLPLLLAALPAAPPTVTLPAEVLARPGRIAALKAETDGQAVRWVLAAGDADLVPLPADGKTALFCAPTAGRYVVFAWTAAGDVPSEAARCVVVVGDTPIPPPTDPFTADVRRLLAADPTPDKAAHVAQLAAVYREAVKYAAHADVATAGDLAARIRAAANSLLPTDALTAVRKRIAEEIAKTLPDDGEMPLDGDTRKKAAALFGRIATSLEVSP
jgi:hypothetical protein